MVRVAVIDIGVHAAHPHIRSVTGGISFCGPDPADYADRLDKDMKSALAVLPKD